MKTRVIVGVTLLPLLLLVVLACPAWATTVLVAAMAAIAVWELLYTAKYAPHKRVIVYSAVTAVCVVLWSLYGCPKLWAMILIFLYFCLLSVELIAANTRMSFESVCVAVISAFFIPAALAALVRIRIMDFGKYYIITAFILAFTSDTGAYFVGCRFGKHKLAPVISPKKTIEGLFGGIASCVVFMLLYAAVLQYFFHLSVNYLYAAIYGVLGSLASVVGDLAFSVVKRQKGIKDYGKLLPGHGGILDRFDSTVIAAPLTELLVLVLPLVR